jgi:hypothetical protein
VNHEALRCRSGSRARVINIVGTKALIAAIEA